MEKATLSPSKKFSVNGEKKTIDITHEIGALDFYKECMKIFARPEFMDNDIPVKEYHNAISFAKDWKYLGFFNIVDQNITFTAIIET